MVITLHNTSTTVNLDGVDCRVWEGHTANGIPITAFIPRIAVARDHDQTEFTAELQATPAPTAQEHWPTRMIL